ncbi:MAG: CoA transferase subunit B, partial [Nitrospinae bacterium]|nr:CoA transferase subunit B [Nitrospinota bacterium]
MATREESGRIRIAKRIARELKAGDVVNIGIGLPTLVVEFIPNDLDLTIQSENGFLGLGQSPKRGEEDPDLVNAGGGYVTLLPGGVFFDSITSFGMIRGGYIDVTILGALQVDQEGNLANWMIPGQRVPGIGGAMDLAVGAKRVIVATEHVTREGHSKILKRCTLPLTARREVDLIVSDLAVMEVTPGGLLLREVAPHITTDEVRHLTDADLIVPERVGRMEE